MPVNFTVQHEDSISPFWTKVEGIPNIDEPEADERKERDDRVTTLDIFNAGYVPARTKLDDGQIGRLRGLGLTANGEKILRSNFGCGDAQDAGEIGVTGVKIGKFSAVQMLPTNDPGPGQQACPYLGGSFGRDPAFAALLWDIPELDLKRDPPSKTTLDFIHMINEYGAKEAIDSRRGERYKRETVRDFKVQALRLAFDGMETNPTGTNTMEFSTYVTEHLKEGDRLLDYAMFMTMRHTKNIPWQEWAPEFKDRDPLEILADNAHMQSEVRYWLYTQWVMERQWKKSAGAVHDAGGYVMMDRAYSVLPNNAEVWRSYRDGKKQNGGEALFELDANGNPTAVTGCNIEGDPYGFQKWGHVLLRFKDNPEGAAEYILETLGPIFEVADIARVDHWLGLGWEYCRIWEEKGILKSQYHVALRHTLFKRIREKYPNLYIVAEDVGTVNDTVTRMRKETGVSGMASPSLLNNTSFDPRYGDVNARYSRETIAFTDSHDSKAIVAWYDSLNDDNKTTLMYWMYGDKADDHRHKPFVVRDYVRWIFDSRAHFATTTLRTLSQLETETGPDGPVQSEGADNRAENQPGVDAPDYWQLICSMTRAELEKKMEAVAEIAKETNRGMRDLLADPGQPRVLALQPRAGAFTHAKPGELCVVRLGASAMPKDLTAITLTSNLGAGEADGPWPEIAAESVVCKRYKDGTYVLELAVRIPADAEPGKLYGMAGSVKWGDERTQQLCKMHDNMAIMVA